MPAGQQAEDPGTGADGLIAMLLVLGRGARAIGGHVGPVVDGGVAGVVPVLTTGRVVHRVLGLVTHRIVAVHRGLLIVGAPA